MQEVFEKIKQRIRIAATEACGYTPITRVVSEQELEEIIEQIAAECNNGWILCSDCLPEVPEGTEDEDCPEFNVMIKGAEKATTLKYSWDGTWFDESGVVYVVIAWQPLPEPCRVE